jgi:hypothetical protein
MVDQRGATALERLEIGGRIVWGTLVPTPIEDPDPLERQGPYSRLMGFACIPLLLV